MEDGPTPSLTLLLRMFFFSRPTFITFGRGKHFVEKIQWNKDIDKELVSSEVLKPKMREVHDFPDWSIIHQVPFLEAVGKGSRVRDVDIAFRFVYYTILGECEHRQQNDEDMPFKAHPREAKLLVLTELDFRFRLKIHVRLLASAFVRPFRAFSGSSLGRHSAISLMIWQISRRSFSILIRSSTLKSGFMDLQMTI